MTKYNFHTHSCFDDGKEYPIEYLQKAATAGLKAIGFSGHVPLPLKNKWSLTKDSYLAYVEHVRQIKIQNKIDIDVYLGLEIDYTPGICDDFSFWIEKTPLDYCIGSVHIVRNPNNNGLMTIDGSAENFMAGLKDAFGGDIRQLITAFYTQSTEMVETQQPDIIGHLDKVKMHLKGNSLNQEEDWYRALVQQLLEAIKEKGTIVELNTRGVYSGKTEEYFPSDFILQKCLEMNIPLMVATDAHDPSQIQSHFTQATGRLKEMGFEKITTPFFESYL